jgi:dihydroflavonol-4-reductase
MKAFITGGTGFIGGHVITRLLERGHTVHALVRSEQAAVAFEAAGVHPVRGDILDVDSMRAGMRGSDMVFHVAGWYKVGARDKSKAHAINVEGTRNVLGLAHELKVPRIIYTSTVAVFGDTEGQRVNESYIMPPYKNFLTEYDRTKWKAHYEVAEPMIRKGAPVTILMPGGVYGPGDPSLVGSLMKLYYQGLMPIVPGPEFVFTYAHVADVAEAHILAAERGKSGESYILAGPAVALGDMFDLWAFLLNRRPPTVRIPGSFLSALAPLVGAIENYIPLPEVLSGETLGILDASYGARSDKAFKQLGWRTRPVEDGMQETLEWIARGTPTVVLPPAQRRRLAGLSLGAALVLLVLWLRKRMRD